MLRLLLCIMSLSLTSLIVAQTCSDYEGKSMSDMRLTPYLVENRGLSVIVCPGGSYFWHDMETEGIGVAQWLQENGVNAFVLKYRTANVPAFITHHRLLFRGNRYPDPQDDLRDAILYLRANSESLGISPDSIGVMGFSAGGHLVMSAAEFFEGDSRPLFSAPIYPVVTMRETCTHARSRRALLGDNRQRSQVMRDSLSLELHVPDDCVPIFLVNCVDDPVVDYHNSELLDSALTAKNIPHVYLQYKTGGHGFGASETKGTEESRQWKGEFLRWLDENVVKQK